MSTLVLPNLTHASKPVFGMIHLSALPGSPRYAGDLGRIRAAALADLHALEQGGIDGVIVENFNDNPFFATQVPPYVVAHMARIIGALRDATDLPLGVNVLRNDAFASLGIAHAVGADFIRVNVLSGARVTDQGVVEGQAAELSRQRMLLGAESIRIFADVNVKHSAPLGQRPVLEDEVHDTVLRAGADAVIVTGRGTGVLADIEDTQRARGASHRHAVIVGSGVSADTIASFLPFADGFIIGTALKVDGKVDQPVDPERVAAVMAKVRVETVA